MVNRLENYTNSELAQGVKEFVRDLSQVSQINYNRVYEQGFWRGLKYGLAFGVLSTAIISLSIHSYSLHKNLPQNASKIELKTAEPALISTSNELSDRLN